MMGTGQLRESLEARWRERALVDNVVFLGSRNDIAEVLSMADVFVLPSLSEGLSNSLLEAMACGLPVVGTRVSGTEDLVVNNETGLLVEPGDAIGLAGALNSMKAAEHGTRMSMGETSRARIVAYASIESVVMRLTALYGLPFHLSPADMRARGGH
jgi:glycosyltransferase involved in cell wall biosynthesis